MKHLTTVSFLIHKKSMKKRTHRGSDFRDFLKEEGILEEVEELAMKKALALQLERLIARKEMTKTEMAARMKTSRAVVDRLLDASNPSLTISTLGKAARALGRKVKIELVPV
jgi:antitoxin HicB